MKDRMLDAANVLVSQAVVGLVGIECRLTLCVAGEVPDDSKNVSNVSVSRTAGPPQVGQVTCFQVGWLSSGFPGASSPRPLAR